MVLELILLALELLWIPLKPLLVMSLYAILLLIELEAIIPEVPFPIIILSIIVQLLAFKLMLPFIVNPCIFVPLPPELIVIVPIIVGFASSSAFKLTFLFMIIFSL